MAHGRCPFEVQLGQGRKFLLQHLEREALQCNFVHSGQRELKEETGLTAAKWQQLLKFHLSNSVADEFGYIYLATELTKGIAEPEDTEELQIKRVPLDVAYQMVLNSEITDSMSVAGILRVKLMLLENNLQ